MKLSLFKKYFKKYIVKIFRRKSSPFKNMVPDIMLLIKNRKNQRALGYAEFFFMISNLVAVQTGI